MRPAYRRIVIAVAALASVPASAAPGADPAVVPLADHHMHLFSPAASRVIEAACQAKKAKGDEGCAPEVSHAPSTGTDAIRALDAAGIRQGVLLSGGYLFGSPDSAAQHLDVAKETRAENRYTLDQAKGRCGRLIPFISVDPLTDGAIREIDYWGRRGGAAGLKLHLGNSGFDFRNPAEVRQLAAVFAAADRNRLAIIIHLQTQSPSYGPDDARIFLREVAPFAKDVAIQVAHIGSGGGLDRNVLDVLRVFADAFRADPGATKNILFDMAMVPDLFSNTRKLSAKSADTAALDAMMRDIGFSRFLPGSDYTLGLSLAAYYADQRLSLGLSQAEWGQLMTNVAPYVGRPMSDCRR